MTARPTVRGALSARRIILLTTISGVAAAALFVGVGIKLDRPSISSAYAAENAMRPAGFADLVAKVKPSVISVRAKMEADAKTMSFDGNRPNPQIEQFFRRFGMPDGGNMPEERRQLRPTTGQGSGFFITADGYAVTNHHVVARAKSLEVSTDDGKTYSAKVIGSDPRTDLALIKIDGRNDFPYVKFSDRAARVGDWVVAVGNPFGLGGTVTAGIVSARGRDIGMGPYDDFIQIDAPINKGNSGGPTFDMDGNVIGINTAIYSPSGGNVGIAFGVPAEIAKPVVAQLKDKGVVSRGWIGVNIQPVTDEIAENLGLKTPQGALVAEPQANSPAAKAGVLAGDVITAVNGAAVKDARDLARQIGALAPGAAVKLDVWRKGETKTYSLTLAEMPKERQARAGAETEGASVPKLGLTLAPAGQVAGSSSEGVVVVNVEPNGLAAEHGFKTGDVILDVGGKKVTTPADVRSAMSDAQSGGKRTVLMRLKSDAGTRFVAIPIARA
jgi:serine protease Do